MAPERIDLAVIGGGPAGLAAAIAARAAGVERVVVLEREAEAGGIPRHCGHPPFGWAEFRRILTGPTYARRIAARASASGVDIRCNHTVVQLGPAGELACRNAEGAVTLAAKRVVLATGARETPRSALLATGDRPLGVLNTGALQSLVYLEGLVPFRRPVIVGTELVSYSAILTARRAGIRPVAMIDAGPGPIARWPCAVFPRLLGIPVHYGAEVADIRGRPRVEAVDVRCGDGSRHTLACDGVLFTGGFVPAAELVRQSPLALDPLAGGPVVDQYGRCTDPAYFAAGNLLRPVETAGWSYREGTAVGRLAALDLQGRLPAPDAECTLEIAAGDGLKYALPQRIVLPWRGADGLPGLQLRVRRAITGLLTILAGNRQLYQRRVSVRPERRLIVPLDGLDLPDRAGRLQVGFQG
ncbi:MAG: FAD-dependent oxidoreductase [Rhodospirillaceae bacterium]|nr:FAD-dependent oxidoreductase [Rhodospirillaceae bacterium]